mmetsp:Transcript_7243/g.19050  ORF Transcript_7243/g.19050 Transcript_7243/m.19050 type:complete len:286 (+) Transcript_7243:1365-2222(+)
MRVALVALAVLFEPLAGGGSSTAVAFGSSVSLAGTVSYSSYFSSISSASSALLTSSSPLDESANVTLTLGLPTCVLAGSLAVRAIAAATPVMLNDAMGEVGAPLASSRYESVTKRSSLRVIVISFLCGNLVLALKSTLSFDLLPLSSASSSAGASASPPASRIEMACGKASVIANSRSRKEVDSLAAYSVAPSAPASSPLIEPSSVERPKKSLATSFTRGMRVAPPMTSTRCTCSLVRLACASALAIGARKRSHNPAFSARASKSSRLMTMRRSRSSWTASTPTW